MKYFCATKNTTSAGAIASTDIARMRFHSKASVVSMDSLSASADRVLVDRGEVDQRPEEVVHRPHELEEARPRSAPA